MIKAFEINNYKCFQKFKIDKLSKINIISGGNNVGKTALLEAILLVDNAKNIREIISTLEYIFKSRDLDIYSIKEYLKIINLTFNKTKITHKFRSELDNESEKEILKYQNPFSNDFLVLENLEEMKKTNIKKEYFDLDQIQKFQINNKNYNFINSSKPKNNKLTDLYSGIQDLGIQDKFLEYLQIIDNNIIRIEPQLKENKSYLRITLKNNLSLLSSELGEGTNRFIEILATILINKNKIILIDEIENGIHYSKLKDIWKAIIEIVEKEGIQLFITTHDKESIEALNKACKEKEFKDITSIKLYKDENNKINPTIMFYDNLSFGIEMGEDFR
jgi:AAA15 family ATPase/GTPase